MPYDLSYRAIQPAKIPDQPVTLDLVGMYGPKRMWGTSTPLIVRSKGWEPTGDTPGVVQWTVQDRWTGYWVSVRIPLVNALGEVLKESTELLVPPHVITPVTT